MRVHHVHEHLHLRYFLFELCLPFIGRFDFERKYLQACMHSVLTPVKHQTGTLLSEVEFAVEAARAYVRAKGRVKQDMQGFLQSNGGNH